MDAVMHRVTNTVLIVLLFMMVMLNLYMATGNSHSIEQCEERLYEKLTGMKAPDLRRYADD